MNKLFSVFVNVALMMGAVTAQARPCGPESKTQILNGLNKMAQNSSLTEEIREEALFALTLIKNEQKIQCSYQSGFAGSIYQLQTSTHRIFMNFVGDDITTLNMERVRFN